MTATPLTLIRQNLPRRTLWRWLIIDPFVFKVTIESKTLKEEEYEEHKEIKIEWSKSSQSKEPIRQFLKKAFQNRSLKHKIVNTGHIALYLHKHTDPVSVHIYVITQPTVTSISQAIAIYVSETNMYATWHAYTKSFWNTYSGCMLIYVHTWSHQHQQYDQKHFIYTPQNTYHVIGIYF